ncbi:hypothetical protein BGZ59_010141 [Podila verticillata]|nr:hypothetical protein BGZ59_010141 [Podila verticillata]
MLLRPHAGSSPDTNMNKPTLTLVSMPADAVVVGGEYLTIMAKLLPTDMVPIGPFLVPLIEHEFAFEAHQQNTLVRLPIPQPGDNSLVYPCGFIVRDFGGIMVHQMRLHRLIRALDLHYSGQGWLIVRTKLEHYFKPGDIGHELWLSSETCKWKCFIRMKMKELYRDFIYRDVPNILLYNDEGRDLIHKDGEASLQPVSAAVSTNLNLE